MPMFIHASGEYLPERTVDNDYFSRLTGRPPQWFEQLTGIRERRRAAEGENANSMAIAAVRNLLRTGGESALADVDLIVGASYTPWDTIGTIAHVLQREFQLSNARAMYVSTACSSFIDAIDMTEAYFGSGRARKALVVASEHNSLYSSDSDEKSGHLWGDGAAAFLIGASAGPLKLQILDTHTVGLADRGRGPLGITMMPRDGGLVMHHGKDIFVHACREMAGIARMLLERNRLGIGDVRLLVPHQANKRIIDAVIEDLAIPAQRVAFTIGELGNTGCASVAITMHRFMHKLEPGELALLIAFGGGYSAAAALVKRLE
jgi:3-oxoacyl-[acyl-carrier-protein] synthase-3